MSNGAGGEVGLAGYGFFRRYSQPGAMKAVIVTKRSPISSPLAKAQRASLF